MIYQRLSQPEATFRMCNTFSLQCIHSHKFYLFHLCSKENKDDWRATLDPSMADLLLMVSLEGVLLVDYDVMPALTMW